MGAVAILVGLRGIVRELRAVGYWCAAKHNNKANDKQSGT
jgi:hypothetical protein